MANRRTLDEQIDLAQKELEQKEARVKELLGRRRSKEDKARTHRLCRRGGLLEKLFPGLALITDEQFDVFVEKALRSGNAEKILAELTPPASTDPQGGTDKADNVPAQEKENDTGTRQGGGTAMPKPAETSERSASPSPKTAGAAHNGSNSNGGSNQPHNGRPANTPHNNGANGNANGGDGAHTAS